MKQSILTIILAFTYTLASAQLTMPADGGSSKAMVGETIGLTNVTINYGRPALRGREGKIWGDVVHEGFQEGPNFGKPRKIPWRAGANENTTIEFSTDVTIEGKPLKAGKYGLHIAYGPGESIVIFSRNVDAWGSFFYDEEDDALRVKVKPQAQGYSTERLSYIFTDQTDSSALVSVVWDKLAIGFNVSTELQKLQLASIDREMNSSKAFNPSSYLEAANYYLEHNIMLDRALAYAKAGTRRIPGFYALNIQRQILNKLNRTKEADSLMNASLYMLGVMDINSYGHALLREKAYQKALDIFKKNYDKNPKNYITGLSLMRGYAAMGNNKKAIEYGQIAKEHADGDTQKNIDNMISLLKAGKDINS